VDDVADERADLLWHAREREHVLLGVVSAQNDWETVLRCVATAEDDDDARASIAAALGLEPDQATAILEMQIKRVSRHTRDRLRDDLVQVQAEIERLSAPD
jgi:DNA gyrase subunit A